MFASFEKPYSKIEILKIYINFLVSLVKKKRYSKFLIDYNLIIGYNNHGTGR